MAIAEDDEKEEKPKEEPKSKGKKKLLVIVGAVVLLLVVGGVAAMMMGGKGSAKASEEVAEEEHATHYLTAQLDTFIVNLSEQAAFVKVTMLLEYDPSVLEAAEKAKAGGGHGGGGMEGGGEAAPGGLPPLLKAREPMIKDAAIRVLSSKRASEVLSPEGKEKLKEELLEAINEAVGLEQSPVVNIYFIEFIIQ